MKRIINSNVHNLSAWMIKWKVKYLKLKHSSGSYALTLSVRDYNSYVKLYIRYVL